MAGHFEDEASRLTLSNFGFEVPLRQDLDQIIFNVVDLYRTSLRNDQKLSRMNKILKRGQQDKVITDNQSELIKSMKDSLLFSTHSNTFVHSRPVDDRNLYSD